MLAVSNIIWPKGREEFPALTEMLSACGIEAVEMALSCIWEEPMEITDAEAGWLKEELDCRNLKISALHSLTYTRPDLTLFEKNNRLADYVKHYIDLARKLNCTNIVFGSPKARMRDGRSKRECDDFFHKFLREIDLFAEGLNFNIEPLPVKYCDYLNSYRHAVEIASCGYSNIKVQLDLKALVYTDSCNWQFLIENSAFFKHLQVSNLDFSPPDEKDLEYHSRLQDFLKSINYKGYVSMEAIIKEKDPLEIKKSVLKFKNIYSGESDG